MNPLRTFGWTLLLTSWLAGGCAPQGEVASAAPRPRKQAEGAAAAPQPAASAPVAAAKPVATATPAVLPWPFDDEDEFEGEGWTFWPLGGH